MDYDEFGNYIGPDLEGSDNEEDGEREFGDFENDDFEDHAVSRIDGPMEVQASLNQIVLHEDKKYYPNAEEVYPGVKTVTMDEDAQELNEPLIKPVKQKSISVATNDTLKLKYDPKFLVSLMNTPNLIRNIVILGHLHHGKTSFVDILVQAVQEEPWNPTKELRFTDTRIDEQERQMSIKSTALSLVLDDVKEKSYLLNIIDCPGHINFTDESTAAIRAADGAIIVIDVVEGVMLHTERLIKQSVIARLPICVVLNKIDRLILELKLPPQDAYFKILGTLDEINQLISTFSADNQPPQIISPELGNVCFAAGQHGWCFTLLSFSEMYAQRYQKSSNKRLPFSADQFAKRMWGDWYCNPNSNVISRNKLDSNSSRTFIQYILEPLYKIYAHIIGESPSDLFSLFKSLGIRLKNAEYHLDPRPLLKLSLQKFFGLPSGFVTMVVNCVPSPVANVETKITTNYSGPQNSKIANIMKECNQDLPLVAHVVKLYSTDDGSSFNALTRIYSGKIQRGQKVKILGEGYTEDDDEDMFTCEIHNVAVAMGRFSLDVDTAVAGNLILIQGVDGFIKKTASIFDMSLSSETLAIFRPLKFHSSSVIKLAVEPHVPAELPKMVEALRRVSKSYPLVTTKVEESGEHIILGTGELYLDCIMHDLRHVYSDIEIKVADPVVTFCETVVETSAINCFAETPNKLNRITMLAEPLDAGLAQDIESHNIVFSNSASSTNNRLETKQRSEFLMKKYDWDILSSRSIWAFGPEDDSSNVLLNNTLPSEVNQDLLLQVKDSMIQGFKWGTREGPLCDEPIRNVKFRILDTTIAKEAIHRGGGQIIPTTRRTIYSSFLMATPRMMEPVALVEMQAPADCVQAIYPVLARRRGHVVQDAPKPGAPFYTVKAFLPMIDSFGFETDLRSYTLGQVFCQQIFDHWAIVPGDPLDKNVILHPLEPSPPLALARDFMIKTRRRKGLTEDVSINKYLDDAMLLQLAKHESEMNTLM